MAYVPELLLSLPALGIGLWLTFHFLVRREEIEFRARPLHLAGISLLSLATASLRAVAIKPENAWASSTGMFFAFLSRALFPALGLYFGGTNSMARASPIYAFVLGVLGCFAGFALAAVVYFLAGGLPL